MNGLFLIKYRDLAMVTDFDEKVGFFVGFHRIDSFCQMAGDLIIYIYPVMVTLDDEV